MVHAVTVRGLRPGLDPVTACGLPAGLVPVGRGEEATSWPWPPRVADCARFGLTRCADCARLVGTRNPCTLTEAPEATR